MVESVAEAVSGRADNAIKLDFQTGKTAGANPLEAAGILGFRLGARITFLTSFVGYSWFARLSRALFPSDRPIRARLDEDVIFEFPYGDAYWGRLFCNLTTYCPEIEEFLARSKDVNYLFIDCGANYGYMSALVSSNAYGRKRAIAIEADPDTFALLQNNAALNGNRFERLHNAVFSSSGKTVHIYGDKHEARSIVPEGEARAGSQVETLALDDLVSKVIGRKKQPVILKLDVEGVEIEAMKGAGKLAAMDSIVIYEDHGSETNHEVSRFFMEDLGMRIFDCRNAKYREITSVSQLDAIKQSSRLGYDFLATRSKFWLDRISDD